MWSRPKPPLPRDFYDRDVVAVARDLIGRVLVRAAPAGLTAGRIVEAEAYLAADDTASHSHRGPTRRNASMFGPPGHAYVYAIHSRWCVNVVTEPAGRGSAVLLRAVEPLVGLELMDERRTLRLRRRRRARQGSGARQVKRGCPPVVIPAREIARGPARLCEAFDIDRRLDGCDLTLGELLWISADDRVVEPAEIRSTPRVGVMSAADLPLRFVLVDNPFVSRPRLR
ncbi:MAG: DNA-3-methyladenine glycosylase [Planctomycetota bacterium]